MLTDPTPADGPPKMDHHEKSAIRTAAFHAKRRYPGPVGELVARELLAVEEFGFRFTQGGFYGRLVAELNSPDA